MLETVETAASLPADWDDACGDHYFLKRSFLQLMEAAYPSGQRYFAFRDAGGRLDSLMQTYRHPGFNVAMFTPVPLRLPATMVYAPLSIARPSLLLGAATRPEVERALHAIPGLKVILNLPPGTELKDFARGPTLPQIVLRNRWTSFERYLGAMRSNHRRRALVALRKASALEVRLLEDNAQFDARAYALYEQVFRRSRTKIEKLPIAFFQANISRILVAAAGGEPVGFIQMIENGRELVFAFVGLDYRHNRTYDTYFFLLLKMVEYAITHRFERVDLGQTAEDAKLRLGGERRPLLAMLGHSNPVMNWCTVKLSPLLSYRVPRTRFHVFKEDVTPQ